VNSFWPVVYYKLNLKHQTAIFWLTESLESDWNGELRELHALKLTVIWQLYGSSKTAKKLTSCPTTEAQSGRNEGCRNATSRDLNYVNVLDACPAKRSLLLDIFPRPVVLEPGNFHLERVWRRQAGRYYISGSPGSDKATTQMLTNRTTLWSLLYGVDNDTTSRQLIRPTINVQKPRESKFLRLGLLYVL